MLFSTIRLMMIKVFNKIPFLKSLIKLRARKIDIVETIEECELIANKLEK
jgi:hypothetical protein